MISVILPVYNAEKYIEEALDSVLNQTYSNFELILINDGSTDRSLEILKRYAKKDSRIRLIDQENLGLVPTLNKGVDLARFEYIARMDADDICSLDRFEKQIKFLENNPNVGLLGGQLELIDSSGKNLGPYNLPLSPSELKIRSEYDCPVPHPAVMFKKKDFYSAGGYREAYKHAEDYDLWLRMLKVTDLSNLGDYILKYRMHENSVSMMNNIAQNLSSIAAIISSISDEFQFEWQYTKTLDDKIKKELPNKNKSLNLLFILLKIFGSLKNGDKRPPYILAIKAFFASLPDEKLGVYFRRKMDILYPIFWQEKNYVFCFLIRTLGFIRSRKIDLSI